MRELPELIIREFKDRYEISCQAWNCVVTNYGVLKPYYLQFGDLLIVRKP